MHPKSNNNDPSPVNDIRWFQCNISLKKFKDFWKKDLEIKKWKFLKKIICFFKKFQKIFRKFSKIFEKKIFGKLWKNCQAPGPLLGPGQGQGQGPSQCP